jgi:hypothetical protein
VVPLHVEYSLTKLGALRSRIENNLDRINV